VLKLNVVGVEKKLREVIKKNAEYRQQLKKTDGFIRKMGQILCFYRQRYKNNPRDRSPKKNGKDVPALEYLSGEINKLIHGHFTFDSKSSYLQRGKSEDRLEFNYNFDFDPINENNEDIFGIINVLPDSRSPNSSEEEEVRPPSDQYSAVPTKWTPDDASNKCEHCHNEFSWYRWRHHCRMCGKLVCYDCSKYKDYVVGYSDNKVRVCKECYSFKESLKKKGNEATSIFSGNFNPKRIRRSKHKDS